MKPETTNDKAINAVAERLTDNIIGFLMPEDDLPIHAANRQCVLLDIQVALRDAYTRGLAHAKA